ncbi:Glutathione S-transferase omega-like [Lachnellula hyalina]|uniref:Glutathione S-transferase omega-like n=1 Tax=Lachnellula hyalina TaxID=1316788 RepID=A0A8H8R8A2_9HELO|nr:Glutathione S-transferase omega-like [Lachnellula hyalina]TVY30260.1 Glutathione S-transferase omega-like [Lachnellula hyalina]
MLFRTLTLSIKLNLNPKSTSKALFSSSIAKMAEDKITNWVAPNDKSGEFKRGQSQFRNFIKKGGEFPPEKGRYHLYISYACPWAHRALIVRQLKGLQDIIPYTGVHWHMQQKGWRFATAGDKDAPGENVGPDPVKGFEYLRDLYFSVDPEYKGRFTVPTLYDVKSGRIRYVLCFPLLLQASMPQSGHGYGWDGYLTDVCIGAQFDDLIDEKYKKVDLYPAALQKEIEETNAWTYDTINNGVYKSGFATTASAYEAACTSLFTSLDRVEKHLSTVTDGPYYYGKEITEADVRLYTTIIRFDAVYVQHFKTNIRDVRSGYPYIHRWLRELYWNVPAFGETTQWDHIKKHYTQSHTNINPHSITPLGPEPPILKIGEEVPAVRFALEAAKKK